SLERDGFETASDTHYANDALVGPLSNGANSLLLRMLKLRVSRVGPQIFDYSDRRVSRRKSAPRHMSKKKRGLTKAERHKKDLEELLRLRHVEHLSQERAAEAMHVSVRTVQYWEASEEYGVVREEARNSWREAVITHTHQAGQKALETLIQLLDDP